ncbi:MAG: peroxiredoxin family protein [Candidatus Amulumruptor caecigallinarius]|nr:peroxiredoxin family protein [Candidatus Amulumruptor caecigallinarius]MCM1396176.1 peroxiredoxin family protein [Candidatus Amulumruptor caecigallinarius]MCM1453824.1 peroxiredoxin family protein [bacterium]
MKKTLGIITLFTVIVLTLSAHTARVVDAAPGQKAPDFTIEALRADATVSNLNLKGLNREGYVLINFWSSADAVSRVMTGDYDRAVKSIAGNKLTMLSVNFDSNPTMFEEVCRIDGLDSSKQVRVSGHDSEMLRSLYHLENGYRAVLVDPNGVIVAVDPEPATLSAMV